MVMRKTELILQEVQKAVVGKDEQAKKILMTMLAKGHVLLEDIPGVGKTTMAAAFAKAMQLETKRIQFTVDVLPSDVVGFSMIDAKSGELQFHKGAVFCNIFLADEINRTSSKTQAALLEAMEEKQVTVDGVTRKLEEPFIVLATQNPVGTAGTQKLPNAQLDRFLMKLKMGYPDRAGQIEMMKDRHHANPLDDVQPAVDIPELLGLIGEVQNVYVDDLIYNYISELVEATRTQENIQLGLSPRAALAVCRSAKACAFIKGRDYVIPADVLEIFAPVCVHRLLLSAKARLHEQSAEFVLKELTEQIPGPEIKESVIR